MRHLKDWVKEDWASLDKNFARLGKAWRKGKTPAERKANLERELKKLEAENQTN